METTNKDKEDILYIDFQGWPVYKKTLREILQQLGAGYCTSEAGSFIGFNNNDPILDMYPTTLEDDGMGYGVNEMFISGVDVFKEKECIHIWRDVKDNNNEEK